MKKCCEKFKKGCCTNENCKFPHVIGSVIAPKESKIEACVRKAKSDRMFLSTAVIPEHCIAATAEEEVEVVSSLPMIKEPWCPPVLRPYEKAIFDNLWCKNCCKYFQFTEFQHKSYASKGFAEPKLCKSCIQLRRSENSPQ